jgi:putative transposase
MGSGGRCRAGRGGFTGLLLINGDETIAFVFMPEHVHLLIWPTRSGTTAEDISTFLAVVKRPVSRKVKAALSAADAGRVPSGCRGRTRVSALLRMENADAGRSAQRLLRRLTIRDRPGSTVFRFWQEGPGYDRNLDNEKSVTACIE